MGRARTIAVGIAMLAALALPGCQRVAGDRISPIPPIGEGTRGVVVDTDMGLDDALALLFLASRPDVTIRAVTVVGDGLVHCRAGVRNARALLAVAGRTGVPVACGGRRPLQGANAFPPEWRTSADDLYGLDLQAPAGRAAPDRAPDLLARALDGGTMLLTLGPLTNVARALERHPGLAERIPSIVSMAGAIDVPGNAPGGMAEYNVWVDALAADRVLKSAPVTLVPLDTTNAVPVTPFFVHALGRERSSAAARSVYDLVAGDPFLVSGQYFFWDPLAAAVAVEPGLATAQRRRLYVTASQDAGAGWISASRLGTPVAVATDADELGFERTYLSAVTGRRITQVRPAADLLVTFDGDRCRMRPPGSLAGQRLVVRFRNRSSERASAILAGFAPPTTYRDLLVAIGPPGSLVGDAPTGFHLLGTILAAAGTDGWGSVAPRLPGVTVACGYQEGQAFRAWPGGWLALTG